MLTLLASHRKSVSIVSRDANLVIEQVIELEKDQEVFDDIPVCNVDLADQINIGYNEDDVPLIKASTVLQHVKEFLLMANLKLARLIDL